MSGASACPIGSSVDRLSHRRFRAKRCVSVPATGGRLDPLTAGPLWTEPVIDRCPIRTKAYRLSIGPALVLALQVVLRRSCRAGVREVQFLRADARSTPAG